VDAQLRRLLASPTIASKRWIFEQYDGTVRGNTLLRQGDADAGLIRVKGTAKAIAMKSDCNSRFAYLDPFWGGAHAVAEACRNLACVGAEPIGLTDCLNYGNPENPENMWALAQGILGIRQACLALDVPIVSGNVSLYNDTEGVGIYPTPMIGAVGLIEDCVLKGEGNHFCGSSFQGAGHGVFLLGETRDELGGSEYLKQRTGQVFGPCPELRLDDELRLQACVREGIRMGLVRSAHDPSEGGLLVAVLESTFGAGMGCALDLSGSGLRLDALLFGESAGRIVVTAEPDGAASLARLAQAHRVSLARLGITGGGRATVRVDGQSVLDADVTELREIHGSALERALLA
jgi:phosphoribosylformylglycinamidine synthase